MRRLNPFLNFMCLSAVALIAAAPVATAQAPAAPMPGGAPGGFNMRGAPPYDYSDNTGFTSMFDGKTMNGWDADPRFWSIKDGSIYSNPTCEKPSGTVYAVWTGGEASDFVLKYELKGTTGINSGVQFRSYLTEAPGSGVVYPARPARAPGAGAPAGGPPRAPRPAACANPGTAPTNAEKAKWNMNGPQADFDGKNMFSAMFYEQGGRAIISLPGHVIIAEAGKPAASLATLADKASLDSWFKTEDWNQFMIVAKGNTTSIFMNGHLVTEMIDNDPAYFRSGGKIGVEVEATGEVWAQNFWLKKL